MRRSISLAQTLDEPRPANHDLVPEASDHVHVEIGRDLALEVLCAGRFGHVGNEMVGAEQAQFLARPGREDDVARAFELAGLVIGGKFLGDFDHGGDAGCIVVGAVMDLVFIVAMRQRSGGFAPAQMIDMGTDDKRRQTVLVGAVEIEACDHVASGFLLEVERNVAADRNADEIAAGTLSGLDVLCHLGKVIAQNAQHAC